MAIAYIYYDNHQHHLSVYLWEANKESVRYKLFPYDDSKDIFACDEILVNFPKNKIVLKKYGKTYETALRDPTKDIPNLKHQAHFPVDPVNWQGWADAF